MAKLTVDDVEHIAHLAKLKLTSNETKVFQGQLSNIVSHMDELSQVDTSGVEPTSQTTGLENIKREDLITESVSNSNALSGTEESRNGYFKIPIVIKSKS